MKKSFFRFMLLALALAGTLVACKRETVEDNPDYNPQTKEVTTQFVLSVETGNASKTKMTAANTQNDGSFRGIVDAKIISFISGVTSGIPYVNKTDGTNMKKDYSFGTLLSSGEVDESQNKSRRILQLSLDLGTDAVLFYGKAINENPGKATGKSVNNLNDDTANSIVKFTKPSDIYFDAVKRIGGAQDLSDYDATARLMIFAINAIIGAEVEAQAATDTKPALPALSWKELGHQYEINNELHGRTGTKVALNALEDILGKLWSTFTWIKTKTDGATVYENNTGSEYRAGSSGAVKWMMQDMFNVMKTVRDAEATTSGEQNAVRLANKIEEIMDYFFKSDWTYKPATGENSIQAAIMGKTFDNVVMTETIWNSTSTGFVGARNLNNYPYLDFNIPTGAAQLYFDRTTDKFSYKDPNAPLVNPNAASFDPRKYLYPLELYYYVNSPLRVSNAATVAPSNYQNGAGNWDTDANWAADASGWTAAGSVSSGTRGVAVQYNVNYGVAMLETTVDWGYSSGTTYITSLQDNKHNITGDKDNNVFLVGDMNLTLRGVLVGGQNPRANWQFLRRNASGDPTAFDGVVYDDAIANASVPTKTGDTFVPNYTLVFDNYDSGGTQNSVYVALEFVNNGDGFYGRDNFIPNTGIFYLVGELKPNPGTQTITWPAHNQIPPLYGVDGEAVPDGKTAGQSKQIPRVFIQDFVTNATFRIGATSLQHAYLSIPDLRSSQMSLGLSVDLEWNDGFKYDIEL